MLIVLAAGQSTRMGSRNKLLLRLGDRNILEHSVAAAVEARVGDVFVVTGRHNYGSVLASYAVQVVPNPDYEEGMASSIRAGVKAAGPDASAFGILLADMPFIRPATITRLAKHLGSGAIVVPRVDGNPGHPVLFAERYRTDLLTLRGDVGARSVLQAHEENVVYVDTDDPGILQDIDTEEAYLRL